MPQSVFLDHAAEILGVSLRTVYYRIREGRLRTVRACGSQRVLLESIQALLRQELAESSMARVPGAVASSTGPSAKSPGP